MKYISTRDRSVKVSAAQAITQGISAEGGLFVPESLPALDRDRMERLVGMSYTQRACDILGDFLDDFSPEEIKESVEAAYGSGRFTGGADGKTVAPIVPLTGDTYMLELWHGPTCAFKDMALQLLPQLLTRAAKKTVGDQEIDILVATSGDTGKAALEGFRDVPGTRILVFYPQDGVSAVQKLQMATQEGENVAVCSVRGNFDDAQTGVKKIFTDPAIRARLEAQGKMFSSANSINWGRLVPQIVYYVSAYCDLVQRGEIGMGETVNVSVPTGNFGNILAAYYAKKMGVPFGRLICASNINNVLTDFIRTGVYDRRRAFHMTASPSMDILISSNLERLLFALYQGDSEAVAALMKSLAETGTYTVSDAVLGQLQGEFFGGFCDETRTQETIRERWVEHMYLADTHTAVAIDVREQYLAESKDETKTIVVSTASPYKFAESILSALRGAPSDLEEFSQAEMLAKLTHGAVPRQIADLKDKPVRFETVCDPDGMEPWVCETLGV